MKIIAVIPCYKVKNKILDVITSIGPEIDSIIVVDDCCPQKTGHFVKNNCHDKRVTIINNKFNLGVGGAVIEGYKLSLNMSADIVVKIDGDGQMNADLIPEIIEPIVNGLADYTKGNRFFYLESIFNMPKIRILGNAALSFITKLSTGYWDIFDPTNGFTAIHSSLIKILPLNKINKNFFFESDMLFRLSTIRAVVHDIPMHAKYDDEVSNLKIHKIIFTFIYFHIINFFKRIFYNYYLRGMSISSFELPLGLSLILFGIFFGANKWLISIDTGTTSSFGTVMIVFMSIILGIQFILSFITYDITFVPKKPIQKLNHN